MRTYLLTTTLNPDRTEQAKENLRSLGVFNPVVVYGIEKNHLEHVMLFVKPGYEDRLTNGEIAVAFSHLTILKQIAESGEGGLVFEDDFRLWTEDPEMTWLVAKKAINNTPIDTDFCYFSKWHTWNPEPVCIDEDPEAKYRKIERPTFGIQCYYMSPRCALYFMEKMLPLDAAVDVLYHFQFPDDMVCRHHYPELFWHEGTSVKDDAAISVN